jgi:hypothetical protein
VADGQIMHRNETHNGIVSCVRGCAKGRNVLPVLRGNACLPHPSSLLFLIVVVDDDVVLGSPPSTSRDESVSPSSSSSLFYSLLFNAETVSENSVKANARKLARSLPPPRLIVAFD